MLPARHPIQSGCKAPAAMLELDAGTAWARVVAANIAVTKAETIQLLRVRFQNGQTPFRLPADNVVVVLLFPKCSGPYMTKLLVHINRIKPTKRTIGCARQDGQIVN